MDVDQYLRTLAQPAHIHSDIRISGQVVEFSCFVTVSESRNTDTVRIVASCEDACGAEVTAGALLMDREQWEQLRSQVDARFCYIDAGRKKAKQNK